MGGFLKGNGRTRALREGVGRADKARIKRLGRGIEAIDTPIKKVGRTIRGTSGTSGRVGRPVKAINKRTKGADDIFDPLS